MFSFKILKKSKKSGARTGLLKTPHGVIRTPAFIPVATLGVVKGALDTNDVTAANTQCQITNTFHFLDLDAVDVVAKAGGLHEFFHFKKPIFTDSGGFQVFSLGKGGAHGFGKLHSFIPGEKTEIKAQKPSLVKITKEGASFRSPRDGRTLMLTPEWSARIQKKLGADFIYMLDICGTVIDSKREVSRDLTRTGEWFDRFLKVPIPKSQRVFSIIQGGLYPDLRIQSTKAVNKLPSFGIAIGGAIGKTKKEMYRILSTIEKHIDPSRPHHLLGIGDMESIPNFLKHGIDLFDCAMPTRIARHGVALTSKGSLNVGKTQYKKAFRPIEKKCACSTCQSHSLAELHFLAKAKETLLGRLLTIHNLFFLESYLNTTRERIERGTF